jgi:hypothetical protein
MPTTRERTETFEVVDDHLVRKVVPRRGEPYEHRCPRASFERIAHAAEELGEQGFTLETFAEHEDLPSTQVAVIQTGDRRTGDGSRTATAAIHCPGAPGAAETPKFVSARRQDTVICR